MNVNVFKKIIIGVMFLLLIICFIIFSFYALLIIGGIYLIYFCFNKIKNFLFRKKIIEDDDKIIIDLRR